MRRAGRPRTSDGTSSAPSPWCAARHGRTSDERRRAAASVPGARLLGHRPDEARVLGPLPRRDAESRFRTVWGATFAAEGAIEMTEGATGLEATIEITEADYPEIMRIVASDGEVDNYLASAGVAARRVRRRHRRGTALCVQRAGGARRARCSTSWRSARWPARPSRTGRSPCRRPRRLAAGVGERREQRGAAAGRLPRGVESGCRGRDSARRSSCSGSTTTGCGARSRSGRPARGA